MTKRHKPTGINGLLRIEGGGKSEFLQSVIPSEKAEIEAFILKCALNALDTSKRDVYQLTAPPEQLDQNDFDFELKTANGTEYLDLVEFAPIERYGGYEGAPNKHVTGTLADLAWEAIKKKSEKYGLGRTARVHLLMYITDFRFLFNDGAVTLLSLWCARRPHGFRSIVYFANMDDSFGLAHVLHPNRTLPVVGDEHQLRNRVFVNLDPRSASPTPDGNGVMFGDQPL